VNPSRKSFILTLGALGVVFGDIGTSPIYALRECLSPSHGVPLTPEPVIGVVSLLVWTLILIVCVKYLGVVLRADNRGEGGILALVSLLGRPWALVAGILGAALLYADGVLTPAVSVLSALEGLDVVSPVFHPWILPAALAVLVVLFAFQARGTARISALFGPVIVLWFVVLGALGLGAIAHRPEILGALNPGAAVGFAVSEPALAFGVLGFLFLAVTGTEALYADLGHFGKGPIRLGWYALAFPALVLNYLGQGAAVLADPAHVDGLFFRLAPDWFLVPLVVLSTLATVIASQAVITGAFSLARQSIQLGLWPRMKVRHTSSQTIGQVYVPLVNTLLFLGTVALVLGFRESANLADAYGIAVSATMLLTTVLLAAAARRLWGVPVAVLAVPVGLFLAIDGVFFLANVTKLFAGGWVVLVTAAALVVLMTTWKKGRTRIRAQVEARQLSPEEFAASIGAASNPVWRVPRGAVYLAANPKGVPPSLLHNLNHNRVLHDPMWLVSVVTLEVPFVGTEGRATVRDLGHHIHQVQLAYGFSESPDLPRDLAQTLGPGFQPPAVTYFLGKESLILSERPGMARWRKGLFAFLAHNALDATAFFGLPPGQVVELGGRSEL